MTIIYHFFLPDELSLYNFLWRDFHTQHFDENLLQRIAKTLANREFFPLYTIDQIDLTLTMHDALQLDRSLERCAAGKKPQKFTSVKLNEIAYATFVENSQEGFPSKVIKDFIQYTHQEQHRLCLTSRGKQNLTFER